MNESPISTEKSHRNVILCANVKAGAALLLSGAVLILSGVLLANVPHGFSIISAIAAVALIAFVIIAGPDKNTMNIACNGAFVAAIAAMFDYPIFSWMLREDGTDPTLFLDNLFSGVVAAVVAANILAAFLGYRKFFMERCRNMD